MANEQNVKNVVAVCNDFIDSKILFVDRKIEQILEAIAQSDDVYALIADCLEVFNKDKEFERAFLVSNSGKGAFNLPKDEAKIIAFVFCLLADINSNKINFDELIGKFFVNSEGKKDYHMFMNMVIVPFRDLISEAFGVSSNITTVEAIENMKEAEDNDFDEDVDHEKEEEEKHILGKPRFKFRDELNLEKTFELAREISEQIYYILDVERKQTEEVCDGMDIINSIVMSCEKADFEMLYSLVMGLKYTLKSVKNVRFLVRELVDVVRSRLY